ncbi:MAG: ATP-binding cassette domain-containing protein [Bacillota bacterium]
MAVIEINDIYYTYRDGTEALRGLSLYVEQGERVALLGPNGAGKSTLLLHLNGINLPRSGKVSVLGREVSRKTEKWVRSRVGIVFQDPDDQVFSSTVWDDVAFGPKNMGLEREEIESRVRYALEAVGMLGHSTKAPYHLSYGQKKRVAIAGVLAMMPEIVVLDEPMAFLDPRGKDTLQGILNWMHDRGQTIIIATHDVDFAVEWADRVVIIKDGKTLAHGGRDLLRDWRLVEEAQLRLPLISKVFLRVAEMEIKPLPQTISEAVDAIRELAGGHMTPAEKGRERGMESKVSEINSGYNAWLEPEHLHYHSGVVQARALWGRMMKRESWDDIRGWISYAVDPSGALLDADIAPGEDNFYKVAFYTGDEGLYNLVMESDGRFDGGRLLQRARIPVPVGHHIHGNLVNTCKEGLDVYCEEYREYGPGQEIILTVMLNGRPLPGSIIKATYHFHEGDGYPWTGETGEDGRVKFTFPEKGHWLFTCTHSDSSGLYTSSFVIAGVR